MPGIDRDSLLEKKLLRDLDSLLAQKERPNSKNKYVLKEDLLEMSALLDEMKGMEKNAKRKAMNFYKAYLINVVELNNDTFLVQLSYQGIGESIPALHASFKLLAKRRNGQFYFYSPLKKNTATWKSKKINNINFHFKDTLYNTDARLYLKTVNFYDKKINAPVQPIEFYYCDNFPEALQILGVDFKSDYKGIQYNDITSHENNATIEVNGGYNEKMRFDPHDLWHDRLHMVLPVDTINRPVDEGCAYLYGGSWGFSWDHILKLFKKYASENPNADWQNLYTNASKLVDGDKPVYIAYVINALIVRKIEKEKGFAPVMQLLSCGKRQKGDDNYFIALEKVTGITKAGFNEAVWKLVKAPN
jgi:hypothetical protein